MESRSTPARVTVVVGFAEALSAPEVVWSLVDAGFEVVAFARRGRASAVRHSRHVVCHEICAPESDLQTAISELHSLMVSLSVGSDDSQWLLFPLDDKAVYLCSKIQVDGRWVLIGPHDGCADFALNKYLQTEAARNAGFKVPKTQLVRTADDILKWSDTDAFPMILRPVECVPCKSGVPGCRQALGMCRSG